MSNFFYNPGCALMLYKPGYANKILGYLNQNFKPTQLHSICCHHDPQLPSGSCIINTCAGCDRRFRSLYEGITTISLWEVLAETGKFPFPDHNGLTVSIHDACPIRPKPNVHKSVRSLLKNMNIEIVETEFHGEHSICCGDSLYSPDSEIPIEKVHAAMRSRAESMPCEDVCVYCVSCIKSMHIGGKSPRYLLDLLFNESTEPQTYNTVDWHKQVQAYIDEH